MRLTRSARLTALLLYLFSQTFFLINIQFPAKLNFDEFHYVPSAKQFLAMTQNQNWEHPPLGKLIMALGISIWGDEPMGWRFMSTVFGALTLVGMYVLAWVLFESESLALWVALVTLFNQLLYVQARIGMLDTFMFCFLVWAMAAFCATWNPKCTAQENRKYFRWSGVMFGFGTACKWFVVVPWFGCLGLIGGVRLLQSWQTYFKKPEERDWYRPTLWQGVNLKSWVISLGLIPITIYFITFIPLLFVSGPDVSVLDLIPMQIKMWEGQLRVVNSHPYMSHWMDWPLLKRPIWYAFDREGPDNSFVRGVILLGNPLVMWTGVVALFACAWAWLKRRHQVPFLILFFYLLYFGCWAVIPRKIEFYYYYYPAGMMLSFALAYCIQWLETSHVLRSPTTKWLYVAATLSIYFYFFPILAGLKIPADSFRRWMWFSSWI